MKSRLFTTAFDDPDSEKAKAFARHLGEALAIADHDLAACLDVVPRIALARTDNEIERLIEELADGRKASRHQLAHTLSVMHFLLDALLSKDVPDSDAQLWADDLEERGWLEASLRPRFERMVERISSDLLLRVQPALKRRRAAGGVLPSFSGCGMTVEVRPVREGFYRRGTSIEDYEPKIVDTSIVTSIHIAVDEGSPEHFYFQADEDDIDYLINMLKAAKKEAAAVRAYLKIDPR